MKVRMITCLAVMILIAAMSLGCIQRKEHVPAEETTPLTGDYLGQSLPDTIPAVFAPNYVSTSLRERDAALSPDGKEFYYSVVGSSMGVILRVKRIGEHWSVPHVASFSGEFMDIEPALSPDGSRIFFASKRPVDPGGSEKDFDIWYADRTDSGWSDPVNLGSPVNTDRDEFYPSVTTDGTIYFCAQYGESEDIWRSRLVGGEYAEPENLGDSVNTSAAEFNAFVAPDESYLIFTSYGRDDDLGGGDLYISFKSTDGWSGARNLGSSINSASLDYCPAVSPDGKYLFFTSRRGIVTPGEKKLTTYSDVELLFNGIYNGGDNVYWIDSRVLGVFK